MEAARSYGRWAGVSLAVTVLMGVWLRAILLQPGLRGDVPFEHAVHAHSHLGFFGWVTLAAFALLAAHGRWTPARARWLRRHAHATGAAALVAAAAFLRGGYSGEAIALSALHVGLWATFAALAVGALREAPAAFRHYARGALAFLVAAGAATVFPVLLMVKGVPDPWLGEAAVKAFLVPFVGGFLTLAAMAAVLRGQVGDGTAPAVVLLVALGAPLSILLHVAAPAPHPLLPALGRVGAALSAAGTLLFIRSTRGTLAGRPLARIAVLAATAAGTLAGLAAAGVGGPLVHAPWLAVAYLHVLLLGFVTPALADALLPARPRATAPAVLLAAGTAVMAAALAVATVPVLSRGALLLGAGPVHLLSAALAGGALAALGALPLAGTLLAGRCAHEGVAGAPRPWRILGWSRAPVGPRP